MVYQAIVDAGAGGITDEALSFDLGLSGSSVRPRRGELVKAGLVYDSGMTRQTASGRLATAWCAFRRPVQEIRDDRLSS
jgi:hypothetical protein